MARQLRIARPNALGTKPERSGYPAGGAGTSSTLLDPPRHSAPTGSFGG